MDQLMHITADGDRWDALAFRYYADALRYQILIAANPHAPITPVLPSGLQLLIPLLDAAQATTLSELPPWKR